MEIYKTQSPIANRSNWLLSLFVIVLVTIGTLLLLQGIAVLLIPPLFAIPLDELPALLTLKSTSPHARMAFLFIQGFGGGLGFLAAAYIIAKWIDKADMDRQQQLDRFKFMGIAITVVIMLGAVLFNALLIDWNAHVKFPEFLSAFEKFARESEDELMAMTKFLTDFQNTGEFLMGLLVIGILAGIGEEVLFRGVLQPKLQFYIGNPHVGIWLAAFIFSAIHLQFYGFLPRMFLGAVFGYLYHYSGSLTYPIVAHILNNSFTVVMIYLNGLGKVEFNIEETEQVSLPLALLGLGVLLVALRFFKEKMAIRPIDG
ncbi:abortive infection protein family [Mariniradius saccharolyticus AK6]|uniref:Abortive infection protein family n=1 Tax=Mariniradius saccharolyticus AK6 TaxID=1239962 RepID=M7Y2A1_9BACT|nr:CPBP family intramembrane glutamic endopeptidase [Mariniradius saccharolyticus]EMS34862.1 abortive infection protein family [Mariniradius saccharolyticus AK6]